MVQREQEMGCEGSRKQGLHQKHNIDDYRYNQPSQIHHRDLVKTRGGVMEVEGAIKR